MEIMNYSKVSKKLNKYSQSYIFIGVVFLVFIGLYASPDWQPSGEAYAKWKGAAMLREYAEFPATSVPLFYTLYLQIFLYFDFPYSVQIEHIVTTLIAFLSINYFLKQHVSSFSALLFSLAWGLLLWEFESGGRLLGISFMLLYLGSNSSFYSKGLFPAFLLVACLFEPAYIFVFGLHLFFNLYKGVTSTSTSLSFDYKQLLVLLITISIFVFSASNQLKKPYNNAFLLEYPWSPIELKGSFNVSALHITTSRLVIKDTDPKDLYKQDWFFTYPIYFGDSKNLFEAIIKYPKVFLNISLENLYSARHIPFRLLFGRDLLELMQPKVLRIIIFLSVYVFLAISLFYILFGAYRTKHIRFYFLALGSIPIILALSITNVFFRYSMVLFPLFLYVMANFNIYFSNYIGIKWISKNKVAIRASSVFTAISVIILMYSIKSINLDYTNNPYYLKGADFDYSFTSSGKGILTAIDNDTRILTPNEGWVKSFSNANFDNIFSLFILPPFLDDSNKVNSFINGLDQIWIPKYLRVEHASISTQEYLRYKLHLLPFENSYREYGFTKVEVPKYGSIYYKKLRVLE